jgi:MFS family permease
VKFHNPWPPTLAILAALVALATLAGWLFDRIPVALATLAVGLLAWGSAVGVSMRQGEAMAISALGVSVGTITLLNAILVGAGVLGARMWGQLGDRFGGKGLMSISLLGLAVDPLWMLAALLVNPLFLLPSYALGGVFHSGGTNAQNLTLVRTTGHAADRIRVFAFYNVAFGLAAGTAPMVGGAILELLDTTYSTTIAYGALFVLAATLRLHAYQHLRAMPAPPARRGRYVSTVVLRAVRRRAVQRTRRVLRLGNAVGATIGSAFGARVASRALAASARRSGHGRWHGRGR